MTSARIYVFPIDRHTAKIAHIAEVSRRYPTKYQRDRYLIGRRDAYVAKLREWGATEDEIEAAVARFRSALRKEIRRLCREAWMAERRKMPVRFEAWYSDEEDVR